MDGKGIKAVMGLRLALQACHAAGLKGGVYDGNFCVWPVEGNDPRDTDHFFEAIEEVGGAILYSISMDLDGGASV